MASIFYFAKLYSFYKHSIYHLYECIFFFISKILSLYQDQQFYELDQTFVIGFDQFYDSIKNHQESDVFQKIHPLNLEEFVAVQIDDQLQFYLVKISQENKFSKDLIHTNPLNLNFFDRIKSKISKQNLQKKDPKIDLAEFFETASNDSPDLLVKDIYGPNSSAIGLPENLLASTFGKLAQRTKGIFGQKQILRSLIMSIAINTAQITGLLTRKYGVSDVVIEKNKLNSLPFNKYFATILKYNNPNARAYAKPQSKEV